MEIHDAPENVRHGEYIYFIHSQRILNDDREVWAQYRLGRVSVLIIIYRMKQVTMLFFCLKKQENLSMTGYLETCAAVALVFFSHQMQQLEPLNMEYGNVLELALYNAALVGMALDGKSFFYDNPLATNDAYLSRSRWFTVACCPANVSQPNIL